MLPLRKPFPMGRIVATPGALKAFEQTGESPADFLRKHAGGDWGTVCPEDWKANDDSLNEGLRILSACGCSTFPLHLRQRLRRETIRSSLGYEGWGTTQEYLNKIRRGNNA